MKRWTRKQQALVEQWLAVPVGTAVIVTKDDGSEVFTGTRSGPQFLGGHTAVIWLDGIAGCYALERVQKLDPSSLSVQQLAAARAAGVLS